MMRLTAFMLLGMFLVACQDQPAPPEDVVMNKQAEDSEPTANPWVLAWEDRFEGPAGAPPNPDHWRIMLGDGTEYDNPGWGNDELQYYTDDPANVALDGNGNLLITIREDDGSRECYYGACRFTSARLTTRGKVEFAYGRIESRIRVPAGGGIWAAFWSLGTDIGEVGWPQTGEIDFMEFVGRLPNEVFGTIHGPGYAGGESVGDIIKLDEPVHENYHVFSVEWAPDRIDWFMDGEHYHSATPADAPGEWVYNHPFFLLLNVAVGGNFGGDVDPELELPVSMAVDYVRVYRPADGEHEPTRLPAGD